MSVFIPPDWRDAKAYPAKSDDISITQWAWEFLRRNSEYQKDYEHFASLPSYYSNGAKTVKWHRMQVQWWNDPALRYCKYPLIPGDEEDNIGEYFNRTGDDTPFHYSLEDHLIEKWGFTSTEIYDPAYDSGSIGLLYSPELPKRVGGEYFDTTKGEFAAHEIEPEKNYEYTLRFDLRYSIDQQIEEAKQILLGVTDSRFLQLQGQMKRYSAGVHIHKLPKYLRIFDGRQTDATFSFIGKQLHPEIDEENAKKLAVDGYAAAKKLVYGGYKELSKLNKGT